MNKVILTGRLTKDVDLRFTPSGVAVANFTLAVNRRFKNQQTGERECDFINCVVWRKPAESAANHLKKGFRVAVVGEWQTRNYDGQDGKKVYVNECIVDEIDFIDFESHDGQNSGGNSRNNTNTAGRQQNQNQANYDPFAGNGQINVSDDDLPF